MPDLEYALRAVGFATTVLGTCAAVPSATWQLFGRIRASAMNIRDRLLRRHVPAQMSGMPATGSTSISVSGTLTAAGHAVGNTTEERLDRLEQRVEVLSVSQQQTAADLREEANERRRAVGEFRGLIDTEVN